jgi:LacI family transcriptional regulator
MKRRAVTLEEVAQASGVSRPTASVVLNGARSGTRLSSATRERVLKIASEMGYRANVLAQNLATGKSNRIGFYSGRSRLDCRNPFYAEVLGGVFEGAEGFQLDTIVHTSGVSTAKVSDLILGHTMDGLLVHVVPRDPILPLVHKLLIPAVAIADAISGLPSVTVDDIHGGRLLADHLCSRGHRHVLVKQAVDPPKSAITRVASFQSRCEELRIQVTMAEEHPSGVDLDSFEESILTRAHNRATAIMAWSDALANAVCEALESRGISIPRDVAVVGFDGFLRSSGHSYKLSGVRAPWNLVGREAVGLLVSLIEGNAASNEIVLPVTFYQGDTT